MENAGLWDRYGGGIAIRSTFAKLRDSFRCEESVYLGLVKYIDYRRDRIDDSYVFAPLVHKRKYFEDERELRAVTSGRHFEEDADGWRWREEDPRLGISAEVDLNELIDEVRVAPGDQILGDVIPLLVARYGLRVEVGQSPLDDPPRF